MILRDFGGRGSLNPLLSRGSRRGKLAAGEPLPISSRSELSLASSLTIPAVLSGLGETKGTSLSISSLEVGVSSSR